MSDSSYLDHLPSREREKIRKRLRSPEEYERLRETVKGPEDLEREMERNAEFAEVKLALESDPQAQEKAKDAVRAFVAEQGTQAATEEPVSSEAIAKGLFAVTVLEKAHSEPTLGLTLPGTDETAPTGNIAETLSLTPALQQQILSTFTLRT